MSDISREKWIAAMIRLESTVKYVRLMDPRFDDAFPRIAQVADEVEAVWRAYMDADLTL